MLQFIEYSTGHGFWVFCGSWTLVSAIFYGAASVVRAWRWPPETKNEDY